ncbi:MAG: hypothetical protein JW953_07510 [Anaerolineae bacterium]|nr:hypothetical protein [Anaerolineae bacterium]
MNKTLLFISLILLLTITACGQTSTPPPPTNTPIPVDTPTFTTEPPSPTPEPPTSTPEPPTSTPTPPPSIDELAQQLMAQIYPDGPLAPDSFGIEGVKVLPLTVGEGQQPLWAAFSYGLRNFEKEQMQFVAIYAYDNGQWQELSQVEMDDADYVGEDTVQQVRLEPENIWLELQAGVGAHSGTYHLFKFDSQDLQIALSGFSSSPGAGQTADVNNDGTLEVVLNTTDPYVFCYACGVWLPGFQVWQWDGEQLVEVTLTPLPDSAPADLREANNSAVTLAEAGLWKDAQAAIDQAVAIDASNKTVVWNNILISMQTEDLIEQINIGAYPLLSHVFYGDYAAALDLMRPYPVEELFGPMSPLVVETPAQGWEDTLRDRIVGRATAALEVQPDLAAAYFLQAWANYLVDPHDPQILADLQKAAVLDPSEPPFADSLAYLSQ